MLLSLFLTLGYMHGSKCELEQTGSGSWCSKLTELGIIMVKTSMHGLQYFQNGK